METKEDFIQAMRAMPDDVVLMCAFSDWLEEHDDPMWEGMSLLAHYGIVGDDSGYYPLMVHGNRNVKRIIGRKWFWSNWSLEDRHKDRLILCELFSTFDNETKSIIRQELAELYPNSDAMRAAVDRSTPA